MELLAQKQAVTREYEGYTRDDLLWALAMLTVTTKKANFDGPVDDYFSEYREKVTAVQEYLKKHGCNAKRGFKFVADAGSSGGSLYQGVVEGMPVMLKESPIHEPDLDEAVLYEIAVYKHFFQYMLDHNITPNIPFYYAGNVCKSWFSNNTVQLYSEKMAGKTLHELIVASQFTNAPYFWRTIFFQIIYTLLCFQQLGIRHNDLHIGNIFVDPQITGVLRYYTAKDKFYTVVLSGIGLVKIFDMDLASVDCDNGLPGLEQLYSSFREELEELGEFTKGCKNPKVVLFEKDNSQYGIRSGGKSVFDLFITFCTFRNYPNVWESLDPETKNFIHRIFSEADFTDSSMSGKDGFDCRLAETNKPGRYKTLEEILNDPYFEPLVNDDTATANIFELPSLEVGVKQSKPESLPVKRRSEKIKDLKVLVSKIKDYIKTFKQLKDIDEKLYVYQQMFDLVWANRWIFTQYPSLRKTIQKNLADAQKYDPERFASYKF